jgi:hypothetical protein
VQNLWEFWHAIDKDAVEIGQSSDAGIGWVVVLAALLMGFFDNL